ncbi:uncharacterized protein LOC112047315 [Bicyclus anynana]|uniref:Uncharacterized protein LOC112047315 n=1 Tax=Bicyclus anynana TaxID=110368 RepID=A0A6J1N500_BICAN|nr:uncharacterized protein LOC112047315 [Bicyclus anynana]
MFTLLLQFILFIYPLFVNGINCLCGENITWSHKVNMEDVFGMWYGVGYAQHFPDRTNIPNEVGCVSLYITDVNEYEDNWHDWSLQHRNYSSENWQSSKSNPWSQNSMAGSWPELWMRRIKRNVVGQKRVRVLWNEDGRTLEQTYLYYEEEPGLWTAEVLRPMEKELISRGIDVWYPDETPRHPDVIRLIEVTPPMVILNHCSEVGNGGIFTLILRRSPATVHRWEWYHYQQQFYRSELPNVYRFSTICSGCIVNNSLIVVIICFVSLFVF